MMGMISKSKTAHDSESYEYFVYTFQRCDKKHQDKWQLQENFPTAREALTTARELFESGAFCRVEVKEKYTDSANGLLSDTTLKIFERKRPMSMQRFLSMIGVEA